MTKTKDIKNWRLVAGQRIRRMSRDECGVWMARFRGEGVTIDHETVREITGGFASQSINSYVAMKIGQKATGRDWKN